MLDRAVSFGAAFDWISPLWTFFLDYRNRPTVIFNVTQASAHNEFLLEQVLRKAGVRPWGFGDAKGNFYFRVRSRQAGYVPIVLEKEGITIVHERTIHGGSKRGRRQGARQVDRPEPVARENEQTAREAGESGLLAATNNIIDKIAEKM